VIKLIDILSEIKVNQPINIKFIEESPRRGIVILGKIKMEYSYITGNEGIVGVEILCGYNDNILEKYADFSYEDHEEEDYYPVDESKEACIKILPLLFSIEFSETPIFNAAFFGSIFFV